MACSYCSEICAGLVKEQCCFQAQLARHAGQWHNSRETVYPLIQETLGSTLMWFGFARLSFPWPFLEGPREGSRRELNWPAWQTRCLSRSATGGWCVLSRSASVVLLSWFPKWLFPVTVPPAVSKLLSHTLPDDWSHQTKLSPVWCVDVTIVDVCACPSTGKGK